MDDIKLWTLLGEESEYLKNKLLFQNHVLEQYKMYVEMADRISGRRNLANVFFLTLHTTIIGAIGFVFGKIEYINALWMTTFPLLAILILCFVWWRLIKSYRQLNTAKYIVIGEFEKKLPSSPYWSAEWSVLGKGKDKKKYTPLTQIENYVPIIFGILYIICWAFINFMGTV